MPGFVLVIPSYQILQRNKWAGIVHSVFIPPDTRSRFHGFDTGYRFLFVGDLSIFLNIAFSKNTTHIESMPNELKLSALEYFRRSFEEFIRTVRIVVSA